MKWWSGSTLTAQHWHVCAKVRPMRKREPVAWRAGPATDVSDGWTAGLPQASRPSFVQTCACLKSSERP